MRISSGISEIYFHNPANDIKSERVFVWPVYNAGRIENIHGITRQTQSNVIYAKPSNEDKEKILTHYSARPEETYTQKGNRQPLQTFQPGTLFDALV